MNIDRVTFKVFPEHRVVVAEISNCTYDAKDTINSIVASSTSAFCIVSCRFDEQLLMDYSYKAVARCHPEDEFNEEAGKKIALKKLAEAYNKSLNKHVAAYLKHFEATTENLHSYLAKRHAVSE